jgi:hypothetical protein
MGTWSRPLFARVSHGKPADYSVSRPATGWRGSAFFETKPEEATYTLEEFMNTGCESHRILDYMGTEAIADWKGLCAGLMERYPVLEWVEFHFYSRDAEFPYCLRYARSDGHLMMCQGAARDPLFMRKQRPPTFAWMWGAAIGNDDWEFLSTEYVRHLDRVRFRRGILEERTDCFLGGGVCRWVD